MTPRITVAAVLVLSPWTGFALDQNANQQSDVWEMVYQASGLPAALDFDGDGWSNAAESAGGTDPKNPASYPGLQLQLAFGAPNNTGLAHWDGKAGKRYTVEWRPDIQSGTWQPLSIVTGQGTGAQLSIIPADTVGFFRLRIDDTDTDGDGITDWEERAIGFDHTRTRTDRDAQLDAARIPAGLSAANTINVSVYDPECSERWPDPAVIVLRRTGGLRPLSVNVTYSGNATRDVDYQTSSPGNTVVFAAGQREAFVEIDAIADANDGEASETVTLTLTGGTGYSVGAQTAGTITIHNETATSLPGAKASARFLLQAAFGPDQDSDADADQIPENVEEVMALGFEAWINDQFTRPLGKLQPFAEWAAAQPSSAQIYNDIKQNAWWGRVMGLPKLRPDAVATQLPDPLRQRVAFALSQIFVISDRLEDLGVAPIGMVNYYDMLVTHSFGNFRDLLFDVATHPCMGMYLSHLGNRKPDPANNIFPDENFAREIMQLFSIGLWELEPNGLRTMVNGQPVPTYTNANITEFARVFTGLAFGGTNVNFGLHPRDFTMPMKGWDAEHDCNPKTLLNGVTLPARTPSPGNTGTATFLDVGAAIDNLFQHPNVGPFIGRLLIQRLVTSNPSPEYIGRVAAAFADNGNTVRGDMKAVVKAILLDDEARNPAMLGDPTFGKLREPVLRAVNVARAFNASSLEGWFYLDDFWLHHAQEPMNSPSVFNYYLPSYSPPGVLSQAGLVAPEFQIINATTGTTAPNYFWDTIIGGLHPQGQANPNRVVRLNLTQEMLLNVPAEVVNDPQPNATPLDPDPLLRRLDLVLTAGTLTPRNFQIIREAMIRAGNSNFNWPRNRLRLAIYLIINSAEFAVQR